MTPLIFQFAAPMLKVRKYGVFIITKSGTFVIASAYFDLGKITDSNEYSFKLTLCPTTTSLCCVRFRKNNNCGLVHLNL